MRGVRVCFLRNAAFSSQINIKYTVKRERERRSASVMDFCNGAEERVATEEML